MSAVTHWFTTFGSADGGTGGVGRGGAVDEHRTRCSVAPAASCAKSMCGMHRSVDLIELKRRAWLESVSGCQLRCKLHRLAMASSCDFRSCRQHCVQSARVHVRTKACDQLDVDVIDAARFTHSLSAWCASPHSRGVGARSSAWQLDGTRACFTAVPTSPRR